MVAKAIEIESQIDNWLENMKKERHLPDYWRGSLASFLSWDDPGIGLLRELVRPDHFLPEDFLPGARSILCFFIPFKSWVGHSNRPGDFASQQWAQAYLTTNTLAEILGEFLVEYLKDKGVRAAYPYEATVFTADNPKSRWSQRHLAYFAGMGSFGINNLLISENGSLGRYFSLITDMEVAMEEKRSPEHCLYKIDKSCSLCIDRCKFGALSHEGFDRFQCLAQLNRNEGSLRASVCGKCAVGLPCSLEVPRIK